MTTYTTIKARDSNKGQQVMLDADLAELYRYEVKRLNEQVKITQGKNIKYNPYAFTEQGIYMLATVLRGELATQQSIFIMRTFREMRHYIKQNQQFVTQAEMGLVTSKVADLSIQVAGLTDWKKKTEQNIQRLQKSIDTLNENFITEKAGRGSDSIYGKRTRKERIFNGGIDRGFCSTVSTTNKHFVCFLSSAPFTENMFCFCGFR